MTLNKRLTLVILLCLAAWLATCDQSAKKLVKLRFRFAPGDRIEYSQIMKGVVKEHIRDSLIFDRSETNTIQIHYDLQPNSNDSQMVIVQNGTGHQSVFCQSDSSSYDSTIDFPTYSFTINPLGKVIDFEMIEPRDTGVINFTRAFVEQSIPVFPVGEVSQGFTWIQNASASLGDQLYNASTQYKVTSFARELGYDCAVIEYDGELRLPIDPAQSDTSSYRGMSFVNTKGVLYFAYRDGLIVLQKERWIRDTRLKHISGPENDSLFIGQEWDIVVKLEARDRASK